MTRKKEIWFRIVFSYFCTRFEGVCDNFLWKLFKKDYQKYFLKKEKGAIVFSRKILFFLKRQKWSLMPQRAQNRVFLSFDKLLSLLLAESNLIERPYNSLFHCCTVCTCRNAPVYFI